MKESKSIGIIKQLCKKHNAFPIVIFKTPRVGMEVDNDMGIYSHLKKYALIYKFEKGSSDNSSLMSSFFNTEREQPDLTVLLMNIENLTSLHDTLEELKERDDYNIIWRSDDYQEPEKYKSKLFRKRIKVDVELSKEYSLEVSYSEIQRYCSNKSKGYSCSDDLFFAILRDMLEFDDVVSNSTFPRDVAKLSRMCFNENGVVFSFNCNFNNNISFDNNALNKFEDLDDYRRSGNFKIFCEDLKKSLKRIVGNEKGKSNTGIDIS